MSRKSLLPIILAVAFAVPGIVLRFSGLSPAPAVSAIFFGAVVVASAFLLAWAAETAQVDISASLATAILALIAVLPEYAVDLYFSYTSGHRPEFAAFAAANMTGSNRLLIGIGWPLVALVFTFASRHRAHAPGIELQPARRIELAFLAIAGLYAFTIPMRGRISLIDAAVLLALFIAYVLRTLKEERVEPELTGVAASLAAFPARQRRIIVGTLFVTAAVFVVTAAEPFANSLVNTGKQFNLDQFLLVQWLAPLASEAPELIVAVLLALKGRGELAIGTLLSSKVNQWTLLVGSLPIAHLIGGGGTALPLDARQTEEFLLTATQTMLGFAVLSNLRFSAKEAGALLTIFLLQFFFPGREVRLMFAAAYGALAIALLLYHRRSLPPILRSLWPGRSSEAES